LKKKTQAVIGEECERGGDGEGAMNVGKEI